MSVVYDFLKECGVFFVTTVDGSLPAARPFGAVMEYMDELYFSTANDKQVYRQLMANPSVQIVAIKAGTRDWIRINGKAIEETDLEIKQAMLNTCPVLGKRFKSSDCEYFVLFKVSKMEAILNYENGSMMHIQTIYM